MRTLALRHGAVLAMATALVGCAGAAEGWRRSDERSCGERARVCVRNHPDRGGTWVVGGETLLPGECARPETAGGTWVRIESRPPDVASTDERTVSRTRRASSQRVIVMERRAPEGARSRVVLHRIACPAGETVTEPPVGASR